MHTQHLMREQLRALPRMHRRCHLQWRRAPQSELERALHSLILKRHAARALNEPMSTESHLRSVMKGVSYRLIGSLTTALISFGLTGSGRVAILVGSSEILAKVVLFWGHERVWNRVSWGRPRGRAFPVDHP